MSLDPIMPSGKKIRHIDQHDYLDGKPRVLIFGHSMPKRLFNHFDFTLIPSDEIYQFGEVTLGQAYASYFGVNTLYGEIDFLHCSGILDNNCFSKICRIKEGNYDAAVIHIGSNDLSGEFVSEYMVASCLLGLCDTLLRDSSVKLVTFVSELKRADTKERGGRLRCSVEDFSSRVKKCNEIMKHESGKSSHLHFEWLPGMWWTEEKWEIDVTEWSTDFLHPGTNPYSEGFQRYWNALRQVLLKSYHQLAARIAEARTENINNNL